MAVEILKPFLRAAVLGQVVLPVILGSALAQEATSSVLQQIGDGNHSTTIQSGDDHRFNLSIVGNDNVGGEIVQSGEGATAELSVEGDYNSFYVSQSGADGNYARGEIRGQSNSLFIDQINPESDAYRNYATAVQNGTGHIASINQTVAAYEASGANTATMYQEGTGHIGTIIQMGTENQAALSQLGDHNVGAIIQDGSGNSMELIQNGSGLDAIHVTQSDCAMSGGCPTLRIEQTMAGTLFSGAPTVADGAVPDSVTSVVQGGTIIVGATGGS